MKASDWIAFGALMVALFAFIAGEVRARRAKTVRNERSDVRWEFSWPAPDRLRVTNRGLDTAFDVDVEIKSNYIVSTSRDVRVARDEHVDVQVAHFAAAWTDRDKPGQIEEQRSDGSARVVRFPEHFAALIWWRSKSGAPLAETYDTAVYRDIDDQPRVTRPGRET